MAQTIFYILAILVMLILLVSTIYSLIDTIKMDKRFKAINEKHIEYLDKQIKLLENMESEDN